jgi:hypothetical protein
MLTIIKDGGQTYGAYYPLQDPSGSSSCSGVSTSLGLALAALCTETDGSTAITWDTTPDYVGACNFDALKGKRLGIVRNLIDLSYDDSAAPTIPVFNAAQEVLNAAEPFWWRTPTSRNITP